MYKVSCIMPCSRPDDMPDAIQGFLKQDYPNKELVIVSGSYDVMEYQWAHDHDNIKWIDTLDGKRIGVARNIACQHATGQIIVHMDSDDSYASDWVSASVERLKMYDCDITGLKSIYFTDGNMAWLYSYNGSQGYVCGATMCYWRKHWEKHNFKELQEGEDTAFCAYGARIVPHKYINGFIARIHNNNTASHKAVKFMQEVTLNSLPLLR